MTLTALSIRSCISAIRAQVEDLAGDAREAWEHDLLDADLMDALDDIAAALADLEPDA
jgi:hypothetical protein